jgi:hypothetical protein
MKNKIGIAALVAGVGVIFYYFFKRYKDKKAANQPLPELDTQLPSINVADVIEKAAIKNANKLSQAEVERLAKWIDAIIDGLKGNLFGVSLAVNKTVSGNSNTLAGLAGSELKKVVYQWQKVRQARIQESLIYHTTTFDTSLSAFVKKLKEIGFN